MKKSVFLTLFIALITVCAAQDFELGIKGGISSSRSPLFDKQSYNISFEKNSTYHAGIYAQLKMWGTGFFIQPEALFNVRACNFKVDDNGTKYAFYYRANYLDVPVLVGLKFARLVRVYGGPNFQFLMNKPTIDIPDNVAFTKGNINKSTTGIQLGAGLDLMRIRLDLRYDFNTSSMGNPFTYKNVSPSIKSSMLMFQIGYKIFGI